MKMFLDTSAFAKRYVAETGSDKVLELCNQADSLVVSAICYPELVSTLSRLVRENKFMRADYQKLKKNALADFADIDVCQITTRVLDSTISLLETYPLRTMDAIHVGCALAVEPDVFVSADRKQLDAAAKAGLKVIDVS